MDDDEYFDDGSYLDQRYAPVYNEEFSDDPIISSPSPAARHFAYQSEDYSIEEDEEYEKYPHSQILHQNVPRYSAQPTYSNRQSLHQFNYALQNRNTYQPPPPQALATSRTTLSTQQPRNSHGIRLVPVSDLPDVYRGLFKFGVFNAVQSSCFEQVVHQSENLVISAPTGSGKTVLFELAIIRMLTNAQQNTKSLKCVYVAPTKALCSERFRDWSAKFTPLGAKCCELTGDTVGFGQGVWGDARNATIIITTGEKWDSLTRNWDSHQSILSQIQLFLVDEVHILNESRGSTLEVVISRMKLRGSSVRFVLVSATVPNITDIASWIGSYMNDGQPAKVFQFGDDFRPCKLTRVVVGVSRAKNQTNDFVFSKSLDYKLFGVLQKHSVGKPILVFCSTRKGTVATAEQLQKEYGEAEAKRQSLPWPRPSRIDHSFNDKKLSDLASCGIAVHHAGLSIDDRRAVEELYLKGRLRVLVSTSTLAVGVNLPAHTVVIKGVFTFQNGTSVEYSDLDIMQMLGRAGRPQFDKDGIGIIMCETELEDKYRALVQGQTVLESSLHHNLSEHLNAEIGLGTIANVATARAWLKKSFLYQRIKQNPKYYSLGKGENQTWEERIDDLVMHSVVKLRDTDLIDFNENESHASLSSTEYGDIMSKFYIRLATMNIILALPENPTLRDLLEIIATAEELSEIKLRTSEKSALNTLRKHNDIRFDVKKMDRTSDKAFLLIQAVLGGISLNAQEYRTGDSQLQFDAYIVFKHISRIGKAIVDVGVVKKWGALIKHGLELVRCFQAKAWEDRPVVLRQIDSIGEKSIKVLGERGITSIPQLKKEDPLRLENILNRRPPFGLDLLAAAREFPAYFLNIKELSVSTFQGKRPVEVQLSIKCGLLDEMQQPAKTKKTPKFRSANMTVVLTITSDLGLVDFRRIPTKALAEAKSFDVAVELDKPSQSVTVIIASESVAGVTVSQIYKPTVASKVYPTRDTRPQTLEEQQCEGLENVAGFWDFILDEDEDVPIKNLAQTPRRENGHTNHSTKNAASKKTSVLTVVDNQSVQPMKLSNGKYACNHSCKDKQKCRHLCCRDGLDEPPKASKTRKADSKTALNNTKEPALPPANPASKTKIKPLRTDKSMEQLEALHKRTQVKENLKIPEGRRLKLESSPRGSRKRRPAPDFSIEFSELHDLNEAEPKPIIPLDFLDDDDDLPDPSTLLDIRKSPAGDSFSDPEMDALMRELPDPTPTACNSRDPPPARNFRSPASTFQKSLKTQREKSPPRPRKRARFDDMEMTESASEQTCNLPLFTDVGEMNPFDFSGEHNGFALDASYLLPDTPDLTMSSSSMEDVSTLMPTSPLAMSVALAEEAPVQDEELDDFAELERWLNSGAVEIVDN